MDKPKPKSTRGSTLNLQNYRCKPENDGVFTVNDTNEVILSVVKENGTSIPHVTQVMLKPLDDDL